MDKADKELLDAFAEGARIETRLNLPGMEEDFINNPWKPVYSPVWDFNQFSYRIAPLL